MHVEGAEVGLKNESISLGWLGGCVGGKVTFWFWGVHAIARASLVQ